MDNQRLRNLTTGKVHTKMSDIYEDMEYLVGESGIMTHMLPNAFRALLPYLLEKVTDERFWDDLYDASHTGKTEVPPMNADDKVEFWIRYGDLPHPFS